MRLRQDLNPLDSLGPSIIFLDHDRSAQDIRVSADVFGRRMHDDIRPEGQRILENWRGNGIINSHPYASSMSEGRNGLNIG